MISHHELRDVALECVANVTSSIDIQSVNERRTDFEMKSSSSDYVTSLDRHIELETVQFIRKNRANDGILGEEGDATSGTSGIRWIIDPIDGTINFLHGIPHFAISIALKSNNEIVAGLIYDPIKDELFYAEKNNGAFLNNQRIRVSNKNKLEDCLFAIGGKMVNELNFLCRRSGSAALDLAYVATGRYDGFFQKNLNLWDIAAGLILVKEAGGIIENLNLDNQKNLNVKASNPNIHIKFNEKIDNF